MIPIKSLTCECGTLCTIPREYNPIYDEFKSFQVIRKQENPQVIDKDTKELRDMNKSEKFKYKQSLDTMMETLISKIKLSHKHNEFSYFSRITNGHIDYEILCTPLDAILDIDVGYCDVYCPVCNSKLYQAVF